MSNSTHSEDFRAAHEDRYFEMFIAEQQLVAAAVGFQVRDWVPFASTFSAFFSRAYDFIRMAAISRASIRLAGSHAGVSIGEDGPSQMALEDIAAFRAVHGSTVLHPSDANQTSALVAAMADQEGISFLRTLRGKTPVRTPADEPVRIGGSRVARGADAEDVAIIACGITLDEADRAAQALESEGISARVLDCYSIKPIDADAVRAAARDCGAIVTVEDHWPEGGLGDAVLEALADADDRPRVTKLAVREMPVSGTPEELLHAAADRRGGDRRRGPRGRQERRGALVTRRPRPRRRELLRRMDAAQERAARLAGGLDLQPRQPGAADRARLLERVLEGVLFEVHAAIKARRGAPVRVRAPARSGPRPRPRARARRRT